MPRIDHFPIVYPNSYSCNYWIVQYSAKKLWYIMTKSQAGHEEVAGCLALET